MIAYGIYFWKSRMCRLWFAAPASWLPSGSGCIILLYGISLTTSVSSWPFPAWVWACGSRRDLPTDLLPQARQPSLSALRTALPVNLFFCLIFASFQAVAYHMPFITHSWLFNEVWALRRASAWAGCGDGLAMLFDIPRGDSRSIKIFRRDFVYG